MGRITLCVRAALILALLVVPPDAQIVAQARDRTFYFVGQVGRGSDWTAVGAQLDVALPGRFRIAPDVLVGEGGAVGALSVIYGLDRARPQRFAPYGGAGVGAFTVDDLVEATLLIRGGVEIPLSSQKAAVRLEVREYFTDGNNTFFLLGSVRIP